MNTRYLRTVYGLLFDSIQSVSSRYAVGTRYAHEESYSLEMAYRISLLGGFLLFTVGVLAAHVTPASAYEVSIYGATPVLYWLGAGGALLISLVTLLYDHRSRLAPVSVALGLMSVTSFVGLPIIRNYYFHGYADPMTHLGNIYALNAGYITFFQSIYPGSYAATAMLSNATGLAIPRTMIYVMLVFALVHLVFVPLAVGTIVPDRRAVLIGLFSGFLFLPINDVSTYYRFHTFSMTTLFFPLVAYVFLKHVTRGFDDDTLPFGLPASTFVFPVVSVALLFFHPQVTVDVLIILGITVGIKLFYQFFRRNSLLAAHRGVYGQFLFLAVLFVVWSSSHDGTSRTVELLITNLEGWIQGTTETAGIAGQRTDAAESISVSVYELFAKLFLVSAIYGLLSVVAVAVMAVVRRHGTETADHLCDNTDSILYFAYAGLGLFPFVVIHTFGSADAYLFRHVGFIMAIATILGAVGLFFLVQWVTDREFGVTARRVLRPTFGVLASGTLVLSLLTVYSSPFIYLPGQHVPDIQMDGYESSFEMQPKDRGVWFGAVSQPPRRYEDAMFAKPGAAWDPSPTMRTSGAVASENLSRLGEYYETHWEEIVQRDHFFAVTRPDVETELVAKRGLHYAQEDIDTIDHQRDVYRVYSNGDFDLYYVDTTGKPVINPEYEDV